MREELIEYARRAPRHRQLEHHDWWEIARYALAAAWAMAFPLFTADAYSNVLSATFGYVFTSMVILGAILGGYGRSTLQHTSWELAGVLLMALGWLAYALLQPIQMLTLGSLNRIPLLILAIILMSHPLERTLSLGKKLFVAVGWMKEGVRIRRRKRSRR